MDIILILLVKNMKNVTSPVLTVKLLIRIVMPVIQPENII